MSSKRYWKSALTIAGATVALAATTAGVSAEDMKAKKEKCYGVVAKGMNDCASSQHSCAGQASEHAHPEEWIYVPAGLCDRLHGGKTKK